MNICSNKICQSYKPSKYNLTHENNAENLCPDCIKQYEKESYCFYCKVHTECADYYANNSNATFNCLKCKKIEVPPMNGLPGPTNRRNNNAGRNSTNSKVP